MTRPKTKEIPFEKEFKEFLEDNNISQASADSYCKYIRYSLSKLKDDVTFAVEGISYGIADLFDNLEHLVVRNVNTRKIATLLINILIGAEYKDAALHTKQNHISALRLYLVFLYEKIEDNLGRKSSYYKLEIDGKPIFPLTLSLAGTIYEDLKEKHCPKGEMDYNKEVLKIIFASRFITQDRKGGTYAVELPIREISKEISYHKIGKSLRKWAIDFLERKVKFLTMDGQTVPFSEINSLKIAPDGSVFIFSKRKKWEAATELADEGGTCSFKDLAKDHKYPTRYLALDHDNPIYQVLEAVKNDVPTLKLFNSKLNSTGQCPPRLSEGDCLVLYDEFTRIIHENNVSFTIMHQIENVKKGKG